MKARAVRLGITALIVIVSCSVALTLRLIGARSTASGAIAGGPGPSVGQQAPNFSLLTIGGRKVTLSSLQGRDAPIAFFCGCNRCHQAATCIARLQKQGKLRNLISVIALDKEGAKTFQSQTHLGGVLLSDPSENASTLYASSDCPRLWRVSATGTISYRSGSDLEGQALSNALVAISSGTREQDGF